MVYGFNLSICGKCGKSFICGDYIVFICPDCEYKEFIEKNKKEKV